MPVFIGRKETEARLRDSDSVTLENMAIEEFGRAMDTSLGDYSRAATYAGLAACKAVREASHTNPQPGDERPSSLSPTSPPAQA
jgi:hypothetical protein